MLEPAIYALAKDADAIRDRECKESFMRAVATAQALFAQRGIVGGQAVPELCKIGAGYTEARYSTASEELLRACRSHGIKYRRALVEDLSNALDRLMSNDDGYAKFIAHHLRPHLGDAEITDAWSNGVVTIARKNGRDAAVVAFGHFSAELETAVAATQRDRRYAAIKLLIAAAAGAAFTAAVSHAADVSKFVSGAVSRLP